MPIQNLKVVGEAGSRRETSTCKPYQTIVNSLHRAALLDPPAAPLFTIRSGMKFALSLSTCAFALSRHRQDDLRRQ